MPLTISIVTPPAEEPLTLQEAKDHLRVSGNEENALISAYLTAAREWAEDATHRQLAPATLRLCLDAFPSPCVNGGWGSGSSTGARDGNVIMVPRAPLQSVTSIQYVDSNGTTQTMSASDYQVDTLSEPGRIAPAYGKSWPATRRQMNSVTITFVAGFASVAAVPEKAKSLIRLLLSHQYENREPIVIGTIVNELPMAVKSLTSMLRWGQFV